MKTLSVDLPDELAQELAARAAARGTTSTEILREVLTGYLAPRHSSKSGSFLELAGSLVGSVEGPGDLSYNKKHLDDYGR